MTPDEYAIHFCNNNDVPFATDSKKYRALVNVIAQAVADEREACITAINRAAFEADHNGLVGHHYGYARGIRDAIGVIRARAESDVKEPTK